MNERWHLTKFYYYVNVERPGDPVGDHVLANLIRPLVQKLKAQQLIRFANFMRFSEGGSHIRLRIYAEADQQALFEPLIREEIEQYCQTYADLLRGEMRLSPVGEVINRKWAKRQEELFQPGQFTMSLPQLPTSRLQSLYEDDHMMVADADLHDRACTALLDLLHREPSAELRKSFARLLVLDFFDILGLTTYDVYRVAAFLKEEWITYFELEPHMQPYYQNYAQNKPRYLDYLQKRRTPEENYALLPSDLHDSYRRLIDSLRDVAANNTLLLYEPDGSVSGLTLMRLFSFFHLNHNRLGISIFQEIFWAHVMTDIYALQLTEQTVTEAHDWIRMVREYHAMAQEMMV